MKNIAEQYGWTHMEILKQQLYFLSKQSADKHNKLKLHTWKLNVLYEKKDIKKTFFFFFPPQEKHLREEGVAWNGQA